MIKCESCGYINTDMVGSSIKRIHCSYCGGKVTPSLPPYEPKTQKAKGMVALGKVNQYAPGSPWPHSGVNILTVKGIIPAAKELDPGLKSVLPAFCRPCPPNPEHGFVESRVIKDMIELEALRQETLAACVDSEIMLTPVFALVQNNSIWTPTLLSVGPGNDGATAGKGAVSYPLAGVNPLPATMLKEACITDEKDPYIEAICTGYDHQVYIAQLRSGPKLPCGADIDFIPAEVVVEEIIQTNGEDLLEWAKIIRALKGKTGTVVYHPGGTMTDHYSVHCRENGVPILISAKPAIGEVLEPKPMPPLDPEALIKGLAVGDTVNMAPQAAGWVILSLMGLHNSAVLRGQHSFWLGVAAAATIKLGSAAMSGEARHAHNAWHGFKEKPDIYAHYGPKSLSFHRARLSRLTQLLYYGFGEKGELSGTDGEKTGCGMGGRKWALCGAALVPMFNSIKRLVDSPTEERASQLVLDLNVAINQAHNGGWWLNKFITAAAYDEIPKGNIGFVLKASTAILQAAKASPDVDKFKRAVSRWPVETAIHPLRWRKAELVISPGSLYLNLKASTVPTSKTIKIPATSGLMKSLITAVGEIKLRPGTVSLKMNESQDEVELWREIPLVAESRNPHDRTK